MRPVNNPYGGVNPLIDKMIGNAYDIVKYVAKYLREIRYVAENMETIFDVAHGYRVMLVGTPQGDTTLNLQLPDNLSNSAINGIDATAHIDGNVYVAGPQTFNCKIIGDQVVISISGDTANMTYAEFRITLNTLPLSQQHEQEG